METAEKTSADLEAETRLEKALSALGLQFGWEGERLFILDSEKITGKELLIRVVARAACLQLSTPLIESPTREQTGVAFWQEWRRRGEATFLMLDEEDEDENLLLTTRIPIRDLRADEICASLRAGILALAADWEKSFTLMKEVEEYEAQS